LTIADTTKDYYHINRLASWSPIEKWKEGKEINIGGESNPYFSFSKHNKKHMPLPLKKVKFLFPEHTS